MGKKLHNAPDQSGPTARDATEYETGGVDALQVACPPQYRCRDSCAASWGPRASCRTNRCGRSSLGFRNGDVCRAGRRTGSGGALARRGAGCRSCSVWFGRREMLHGGLPVPAARGLL